MNAHNIKQAEQAVNEAIAMNGHPDHNNGSRKGQVHAMFNLAGRDAAEEFGLSIGLKINTLRCWMNFWKRQERKGISPKRNYLDESAALNVNNYCDSHMFG